MKTRAYVALTFAAVAAVAVLVVFVLGIGRFDPSPPSLRDRPVPAIPGEILYADEDGCIARARASGESYAEVICPGPYLGAISWIDGDTIGWAEYGTGAPAWRTLSLTTGRIATVDRYAQAEAGNPVSPRGERVEVGRDGSLYRLTDGERTEIFDFKGPEGRQPRFVTWSPDGDWLLLHYEAELWIISRDGVVQGTLAKTAPWAQGVSWWINGLGSLPPLTLSDTPIAPPAPIAVATLPATAPSATSARPTPASR